MQAAAIVGQVQDAPVARWTPPPMPMIEPDKEGIAYQRLIRIGGMTWAEMVRERGYDPDEVLDEIEEWNKKFDAKGVILDSDPRHMSQQGQPTTLQQPKNAPAEMDDADRLLLNGNGHR
jgi:capsid protein